MYSNAIQWIYNNVSERFVGCHYKHICLCAYKYEFQLFFGIENRLNFFKVSLEEEMTTYSSILASQIPWTEEPGGLQSMGSESQTQLINRAYTH